MKTELQKLAQELGITFRSVRVDALRQMQRYDGRSWKVTLRLGRKQMTTDFFQGKAWTTDPETADVLHCLALDAGVGGTFEEFCSDFGYSDDSIKALETFKACQRTGKKLKRFLGEHYHAVLAAEH